MTLEVILRVQKKVKIESGKVNMKLIVGSERNMGTFPDFQCFEYIHRSPEGSALYINQRHAALEKK